MKIIPALLAIDCKSNGVIVHHIQNAIGERIKIAWWTDVDGNPTGTLTKGNYKNPTDHTLTIRQTKDGIRIFHQDGSREPAEPENMDQAKLMAGLLLDHYGARAEIRNR